MPPEVVGELTRAVAWFAMGFAAAVVCHPFGTGWWPDGEDGD